MYVEAEPSEYVRAADMVEVEKAEAYSWGGPPEISFRPSPGASSPDSRSSKSDRCGTQLNMRPYLAFQLAFRCSTGT